MLYVKIKKRLGSFLLDIEFSTNGETLALLGSSGCGKSMTLKCIAGVETPDEGQIILNGRTLFDSEKKINLPPQNRKVGLLFQNYALFPNMTLEENIAIGVPKDYTNKKEIVRQKISDFHLSGLEKNYPHQLSGGQQQRVALARMLVNEPEVLLFDEPFSALDEHLKWQMEQELISILNSHKGNSLYVSHNKDEVYRICDKIAVLNNGKIDELEEKDILFNSPKKINSAILIGCKNISRAKKINNNKIYAIDWGIELLCNSDVKDNLKFIGIHEYNISICDDLNDDNTYEFQIISKIENRLSKTLILSPMDSKDTLIYVDITSEEFNNLETNSLINIQFSKENLLQLY